MFFQHHLVTLGAVFDQGHELAHQQQTPSTRPIQIFIRSRIGNVLRMKSGPLIFNLDPDSGLIPGKKNSNGFIGAEAISMLDCIGDSLVDS